MRPARSGGRCSRLPGSLLVEISLPKLVLAWTLLIGVPGLLLGMAPLLVSLWMGTVSWKASIILTGIWPLVLLLALAGLAWFGGRPLARLIESSFWSLNALGVQPGYIICREGFGISPNGFSRTASVWRGGVRSARPARRCRVLRSARPRCGSPCSHRQLRAGLAPSRTSRRPTSSSQSRWRMLS